MRCGLIWVWWWGEVRWCDLMWCEGDKEWNYVKVVNTFFTFCLFFVVHNGLKVSWCLFLYRTCISRYWHFSSVLWPGLYPLASLELIFTYVKRDRPTSKSRSLLWWLREGECQDNTTQDSCCHSCIHSFVRRQYFDKFRQEWYNDTSTCMILTRSIRFVLMLETKKDSPE